jgi:Na+-transporting NADH:ubiquinone oxidoreductase subunit NqrB
MGVILMMVSPHLWIYVIVIALGLLQKHFIVVLVQNQHRHFFNPSNFALLCCLLFFYKEAHIVLGQLGDDLWLQVIVSLLAIVMLARVNRCIIPVFFSATYLLLQYFLVIQYDPVMIFEELYRRFYSVSFIVFILFMLTDPKTTPEKYPIQVLYALCIALAATLLDVLNGFRVQHLFLSLSLFSVCNPLLEFFEYESENKAKKNKILFITKTAFILLVLIAVILFIEIKQPYYFSMDA